MAYAKRTEAERLAIQAEGSRSPDPEVFRKILEQLQHLAERYGNTEATERALAPAARYLAGAITIYANARRAELPDTKRDSEEMIRFRENQAARLAKLAREMEAILGHPACENLLLLPSDEMPLRALLQKLSRAYDNVTPADEARARRDEARAQLGMTAKDGKGTPQRDRWRVGHALEYAWFISTGQEKPPGRKTNKEGEFYGEFPDFIRAVLSLTTVTRHINPDEMHRNIEDMGK